MLKRIYEHIKIPLLIVLVLLPSMLLALGMYWLVSALLLGDDDFWSWSTMGWTTLIFFGFWLLVALFNSDKILFGAKR